MSGTAETPQSIELGELIRQLRKAAGLSQSDLAVRLNRTSHSDISRWESGKLGISESDVEALLDICAVSDEDRARVFELVREAADPNWLTFGSSRNLALLREYENRATRITNVQPLLIPGLLQTREYAIALMVANGLPKSEAEGWANLRMARREILTRKNAVEYTAVIGEPAIKSLPCDRDVAIGQLTQLLSLAKLNNVTIQVLPLSEEYTAALDGQFVLLESDRFKPVVHLAHFQSGVMLTNTKHVQAYVLAVDKIRRTAMSPSSSVGFVEQVRDQMEHENDRAPMA